MFRSLAHTTSHRPPQDASLQLLQFLKLSNAGPHYHGNARQGIVTTLSVGFTSVTSRAGKVTAELLQFQDNGAAR